MPSHQFGQHLLPGRCGPTWTVQVITILRTRSTNINSSWPRVGCLRMSVQMQKESVDCSRDCLFQVTSAPDRICGFPTMSSGQVPVHTGLGFVHALSTVLPWHTNASPAPTLASVDLTLNLLYTAGQHEQWVYTDLPVQKHGIPLSS